MSEQFNKVIIAGNLVRDVELKPVGNTQVASFTIANNKTYKEKKTTTFLDVKAWGDKATHVSKYLKKGSSILLEGRLEEDTWDDKATGKKRSKHVLNMIGFSFMGGKPEGQSEQPATASQPAANGGPTDDESIPF